MPANHSFFAIDLHAAYHQLCIVLAIDAEKTKMIELSRSENGMVYGVWSAAQTAFKYLAHGGMMQQRVD